MSEAYHYGKTIRKYRKLRGWSQEYLAARWPCADGRIGVSLQYIQLVEYGKRSIADHSILRRLSDLLEIPLWELGLSEYNPFAPTALPGRGKRMYSETLDITGILLTQTMAMRRVAPLPEVERAARNLHHLFNYFLAHMPPTARLEPRFLHLYAQEKNIQGLMHFENKQYPQALGTFEEMYQMATQIDDPVLTVHALQKMGVELNRAGRKQEAINALEEARDFSFTTGKQVSIFANAYLAHIYAASGDALRFERAINTALQLVEPIRESYGDGTDFIVHKYSGILQLKSRGYLRIGEPEKTLAMHEELKRQITLDTNLWLDFRSHLYRARAYMMLKDLEACIGAAREFFQGVLDWQSPHRTMKGHELLQEIDEAGYGDVGVVNQFREELVEATKKQQEKHR